jgi:hypothetical protein
VFSAVNLFARIFIRSMKEIIKENWQSALPLILCVILLFVCLRSVFSQNSGVNGTSKPVQEYLWYEAENMRGFATNERGEPLLNPSWQDLPREKAPGWGMNGPGVSAEWTQGGESEWNSAAASRDETRATIYQDLDVPRAGPFRVWLRYADWAGRREYFTVRIVQEGREVFRHEFGAQDVLDPHDEVSMYWGWAFAWNAAPATLQKGPARLSIEIERAAEARRHVDCFLLTSDLSFAPDGRRKPEFAWMRLMREWADARRPLASLLPSENATDALAGWRRPTIAGRDFLMPWNIANEFWTNYDKPPAERPLYPFNAEPIDEFIKSYSGKESVPIFDSKLIVPVIYISDLPGLLSEGSPFLRYLRATRAPFAVLINYGAAKMDEAQGRAVWNLLGGELREQFLGWISGESIGYVWGDAATHLKLSPAMSRRELLEAHRIFYAEALDRKWSATFHTTAGPLWNKLIPAQSTSSTSFAHALGEWGVRLIGIETAAVMPGFAMRLAFTRGAARQFGGAFLYYHAPNFGDTATTFTKKQNFAGPDFFLHSRYGPTMGPSLSWYRKSYYFYYMAGASAIYLEQGFDQFFKPGPGEHPFQLNPLGRITDEFVRFAAKHPERGTPYTPVAFLLDPAHGWEMTDYPHWPFGVSQLSRHDRALRELLGAAYYPLPVNEGEPATADRQSFISSIFGDIFDVLVASRTHQDAIDNYRALVVGGHLEWNANWAMRLTRYVKERGGVLVLNAAQAKGLPPELTGVRLLGEQAEADDALCLLGEAAPADLRGPLFRYERIEIKDKDTEVLLKTPAGEPLVTRKRLGRGHVIFCALPDLLGLDERLAPFAAHLLIHLLSEASPVEVKGEVESLFNRTERSWVVTLINNKGIYKPQQGLAQVNRGESVEVSLSLRGQGIKEAREWISDKKIELNRQDKRESIRINLPPGGIGIVELVQKQ